MISVGIPFIPASSYVPLMPKIALIASAILSLFLFRALIQLYNFWRVPDWAKNIPSLPEKWYSPFVGNVFELDCDTPYEKWMEWSNRYGPIFRFSAGFRARAAVLCTDPKGVSAAFMDPDKGKAADVFRIKRETLFIADGDLWRKMRHLMNPVFSNSSISNLHSLMADQVRICLQQILQYEGKLIEIDDLMARFTLDVIGVSIFGIPFHAQTDSRNEIGEAVQKNLRILQSHSRNPLKMYLARWFPGKEAIKTRAVVEDAAWRAIRRREENPNNDRVDLLAQLMYAAENQSEVLMDREQIKEELSVFITAGHETSSHTLSWTLYLLAKNRWALETVQKEIQTVMGESSTADIPELDQLNKMTYLSWCVNESMRLYGVSGGGNGRCLSREIEICGHKIPAGIYVVVPQWVLNRSPRLWDRPDDFVPERWRDNAHRDKFFPFGTGVRTCIGQSMALQEIKLMLAALVRRFEFRLRDESVTVVPIQEVTIKPRGGVHLIFTQRAK